MNTRTRASGGLEKKLREPVRGHVPALRVKVRTTQSCLSFIAQLLRGPRGPRHRPPLEPPRINRTFEYLGSCAPVDPRSPPPSRRDPPACVGVSSQEREQQRRQSHLGRTPRAHIDIYPVSSSSISTPGPPRSHPAQPDGEQTPTASLTRNKLPEDSCPEAAELGAAEARLPPLPSHMY